MKIGFILQAKPAVRKYIFVFRPMTKVFRDRRGIRKVGTTGLKLAMLIGAPCAVGLFLIGAPVMALLYTKVRASTDYWAIKGFIPQILAMAPGKEVSVYTLAGGIMQISAIGVLFLSLVQTLTGVIQGMGKQNVPVMFLLAGGIVKVVSMVVLMKFTKLGILGAAISTVLCYVVAGIGDTAYVIGHADIKLDWIDVFVKPLGSALVMGLFVYLVYNLVYKMGHPTAAVFAALFAGVAVYAACLWIVKAFNKDDLSFMPARRKLAKIFRISLD